MTSIRAVLNVPQNAFFQRAYISLSGQMPSLITNCQINWGRLTGLYRLGLALARRVFKTPQGQPTETRFGNETRSDNSSNHLDFPIKLTNRKLRYIRRRDMFIASSSAVGKIITIDIRRIASDVIDNKCRHVIHHCKDKSI